MKYKNTVVGRFIDRPNRFIAHVAVKNSTGTEETAEKADEEQPDAAVVSDYNETIETVHVKNTGRCRELLTPNAEVILEVSDNPARKTKYDLITVMKPGLGWVNIDSQVPNTVVKEWLESGRSCFENITKIKPEYTYGASRVDFYVECGGTEVGKTEKDGGRRILIEVKGCTLEREHIGYFPDAPTERGVKHLRELAGAQAQGYECYIAFVIAMPQVEIVMPNIETHPEFGTALAEAQAAGVKVLYLPCEITPDEIRIRK